MIENSRQLAKVLNISFKALTYLLYIENTENCYTSFNILKKNGTTREISAPSPKLKNIQKKLANFLYLQKTTLDKSKPNFPCLSHGFELNKSIITNAKAHRNKKIVINMDLEDFFDSFHFGRVRGYFNKNKNFLYPIEVSTMIAQIACFKGKLPQGSPSSPIITNLICQTLDVKLFRVAKKFKLNYTRYADDLTFSTNDSNFLNFQEDFINEVSNIIKNNGLAINVKKTRIQYKNSKQTVTGLIVNNKINIDNNYFKDTKAMAHSYYKSKSFHINGKEGTIKQLEGRFSFIDQLDKYNNKLSTNASKKWVLNRRELEFQRFIFYKNFLDVEKPVIITEGKTDPLYLKAALMSLYKDYPDLIEKYEDKFIFKFNFFKKQKNFQYFFHFAFHGGDAMQKVYEL